MAGAGPASGCEAAEAVCCGSGREDAAAGVAGLAEKGAGGGTEDGAVADAACSDAAAGGVARLGDARSGCGMAGGAAVDASCPDVSGFADAEAAGCGAAAGAAAAPGAGPPSVATAVGGGEGRGHQRFQLLKRLAERSDRHLILLTATPHSGDADAFTRLVTRFIQIEG